MVHERATSDGTEPDAVSNESTPLVLGENGASAEDGFVDAEEYEIDELDRPWPATFERSISLLAGPVLNPSLVEQVTKSPKVMPYRAMRDGNNRGYFTPQGQRVMADLSQPERQFKQGITKIQSLDFRPGPSARVTSGKEAYLDLELRDKEAKLYRQKFLKQASTAPPGQHDTDAAMHSPGFHREMETEKMKAKMKEDAVTEKSSFAQCMFNMSNILMGVGMLGLPYIFRCAGWIGGTAVTLTFSIIAWRTSICLGRELNGDPRPAAYFDDDPYNTPIVPNSTPSARMLKPIKSFPDIAREAFGQKGNVLLCLVLYFELFSCLCIFLVTLGDHLHTLFPQIPMYKHMMYVSVLISVPTALLRTPRLLSYLSAVGTCATFFVVVAVFSSALLGGDISEEVAEREGVTETSYHTLWRTSGLPAAFGLIAYTFSGHAIVPSIYVSMEHPKDFEKMITYTFAAVTSCCLIVAASGYYMFGSMVDDQITLSLEKAAGSGDKGMEMLTWLMILTAFSKFTLTAFPLGLGLEELIAPFVTSERLMEAISSLIKLVLIGLALVVAIFVPNFSFLCSLVGLICTMVVSVVFPAAAHLKMFAPRLPWWEKVIDYFFILAGSTMAIVGTVITLFF